MAQEGRIAKIDIIKPPDILHGSVSGTEMWSKDVRNTPARDTGLRNLPFHDADQNRIRLAISALAADLLAWCARVLHPNGAIYEPKRLRLRILAVAGRIVRSARRRVLHIDCAWPRAEAITTGHARLCTLPAP